MGQKVLFDLGLKGLGRVVGLSAFGLLLWCAPALAQYADTTEVSNRLNRLETEVQTLQRQLARGGGSESGGAVVGSSTGVSVPPTQAADFEVRLSQLERNVQDLTGKYEDAVYKLGQMRERLEKLSSDLDFRLSQIEGKGTAEGGAAAHVSSLGPPIAPVPPGQPQAVVPPTPTPGPGLGGGVTPQPNPKPGTEQAGLVPPGGVLGVPPAVQKQYDDAFGLLHKNELDAAAKAFAHFVAQHRDSSLAPNAQYWLGMSYFGQKKYEEAAVAFGEGYKAWPKSNKAADTLYELGRTFATLNRKDDACKVLGQVGPLFPSAVSLKQRSDAERKKLGCS